MDKHYNSIGHALICPKHGPLVNVQRHSHNISLIFIYESNNVINPIASWFKIASGIQEVVYISDLHDETSMYCGTAIEYENAKSDFHSKLIKELTCFNFIWGGLEAFLDSISLPECSFQKGKINSANYFLKNHYLDKYPAIGYYSELIEYFRIILSKNPWYGDIDNLFSTSECVSDRLIGLKVVYKIRNLFAHGAFEFSEPEEWSDIKPLDINIINTSSRVVLMTMQMLLLTTQKNLEFKVAQLNQSTEKGVSAQRYIPNLHLKKFRHS